MTARPARRRSVISSAAARVAALVGTVLALALAPAGPAAAASVTISIPTVTAPSGGSLSVPVALAGAAQIGALHAEVTFDPQVLEVVDVTAGALAPDGTLVEHSASPGRVRIGVVTSGSIDGDGEIAVIRFTVIGPEAADTPLGLELARAWEATPERFEIETQTQNGAVTVSGAEEEGGLPWLWIALAAVAVLGLLVWLLSRRRRPQQAVAPVAAAAPAAAPPVPAPAPAPAPAAPAVPTRFCPSCGTRDGGGGRFCATCGKEFPA